MKRLIAAVMIGTLTAAALPAQEQIPPSKKSAPAAVPQSDKERAGYAIGLDIGRGLLAQGFDVDLVFLARGIKDALAGVKPAISDKEAQETMQALQKDAVARLSAKNKAEGDRFLAENAKKEGVKTTKSGLQYKVLKEGTGPAPKATDMVRTHYHGTFIDGTVFDSSVERREPAEFSVNEVIPGWTEALQMMKVGSKVQLVVPPALAYGEKGSRGIPPNKTLIFEVELLGIVKANREPE